MNLSYCKHQLEKLIKAKKLHEIQQHIVSEEALIILEHAKQLMHNIFTFDKQWDMERCLTPYQIQPLDYNAQRNDDEEWCFMLNRMDYLDYLMLAGKISSEPVYWQKGRELILAWINQHPCLTPSASTRTLDTGIRIMNIMEAMIYLYDAKQLSDADITLIADSLLEQITYLRKQYLPKYTLSNWGSIQTCAIVSLLPLLVESYQEHPVFLWAKDELKTQFEIQVYGDGMHWEQSTMYHVEVLNYGMKAIYYLRVFGCKMDGFLEKQCKAMCHALLGQMTPDCQIEPFGDSDRISIRDVMTRGAVLFQQPVWKTFGFKQADMESLYGFGSGLAQEYLSMVEQEPETLEYDGIDSGLYCIRSHWDRDASFTMFCHGSLGSGHGHSDNLHVSCYHKGKPVLIDAGRYTYREDEPLRVYLKGMEGHNTVIVDDNHYCQPRDSWSYEAFGIPLKPYVKHDGQLHYLEGSMLAQNPLFVWTRKVIVIHPSIWMIVDEVRQDGVHSMKQILHFDPSCELIAVPTGFADQKTSIKISTQGEAVLKSEPCSLRYNELLSHTVIESVKQFQDFGVLVSCLSGDTVNTESVQVYQESVPFKESVCTARKFYLSEFESYTVVIFHEEVYIGKKLCICEGVPFHAKAAIIHQCGTEKKLSRLKV